MENSPQKIQLAVLMLALSAASMPAAAQNGPLLDRGKFSIGAGVANNDIDFGWWDEDATGFQVFGAYRLSNVNVMQGVGASIEAGYMDYGFDWPGADGGVWATFVVDGPISNSVGWLARAGFDFGDDDGLMVGAGLGFPVNNRTSLRLEYVVRDNIDSLQFNVVIGL